MRPSNPLSLSTISHTPPLASVVTDDTGMTYVAYDDHLRADAGLIALVDVGPEPAAGGLLLRRFDGRSTSLDGHTLAWRAANADQAFGNVGRRIDLDGHPILG